MNLALTKLYWEDICDYVTQINPQLASIINDINPDHRYKFYRARYPFGDKILDKEGVLQLPTTDNQLISFNSREVDQTVRTDLGYNMGTNPVSLVMHNSVELCIKLEDRVIPFSLVQPGTLFGLWPLLDSTPFFAPLLFFWEITSGARSLFMLPKISDSVSHNRITKHFHVNPSPPKQLHEHWDIFKDIVNHPDSGANWSSELLFFSKEWFTEKKDPAWQAFRCYLLQMAWDHSSFWRNQFMWQFIFSIIQTKQQLKYSAYIADLVQHVFMVAMGALPGFMPAVSDIAGPIEHIQQAYIEFYNLKHYSPIIMQPQHFMMHKQNPSPVYTSIRFPTAMELAPKFSTRTNVLADLASIGTMLSEYIRALSNTTVNMDHSMLPELSSLPQFASFKLFHSAPNNYRGIYESALIPQEDENFILKQADYNRKFPADSPFFKGCIRISQQP